MQATILNVRLRHLPDLIKRRQEIAKIYDSNLLNSLLPTSVTYQEYNLRVTDRDELFNHLKSEGIETIKGDYTFPIPIPTKCEQANKEILRLPIWPTLKDEQINYVCEKINEFYQ